MFFDSLALRERRGDARLRGNLSRLGLEALGKEFACQVGGGVCKDAGTRTMLLAKLKENGLQRYRFRAPRSAAPLKRAGPERTGHHLGPQILIFFNGSMSNRSASVPTCSGLMSPTMFTKTTSFPLQSLRALRSPVKCPAVDFVADRLDRSRRELAAALRPPFRQAYSTERVEGQPKAAPVCNRRFPPVEDWRHLAVQSRRRECTIVANMGGRAPYPAQIDSPAGEAAGAFTTPPEAAQSPRSQGSQPPPPGLWKIGYALASLRPLP